LGTRNIDLNIISLEVLNSITGWVISDQESVSDHSIIRYAIKPGIAMWHAENPSQVRYRTNKYSLAKFQGTFLQVLRKKFKIIYNTTRDEELDDSLSSLLTKGANIEELVDEFNEALTMACNKTFKIHRAP
jgi:mannosyltransferase OCH1-like enzyme